MATSPPIELDPLDTPEQAEALLLKVFQRHATDILQNNDLDFEAEKKTALLALCDGLKSNLVKIKAEHFAHAAGGDQLDPNDPGPNQTIDAIQCYINFRNCKKSRQQCQDDYMRCLSIC